MYVTRVCGLWRTVAKKSMMLNKWGWDVAKKVVTRGRPFTNAANSCLEFTAGRSKNVASGTTLGPFRKIGKVNHLYRKFGIFNNFFA
jgi:hypothetical protein